MDVLLKIALLIAGLTLTVVVWYVVRPDERVWPPQKFGRLQLIVGWGGTFTFFAIVIALGLLDWGNASIPHWLRYAVGPALIVSGNVVVWSEVISIGTHQTMGATGQLKTDGFYRFSRNPQYVSDIAILTGWALFSASPAVMPAAAAGIVVFLAFPFAEEGWLEEEYGTEYHKYRANVRRYI